ncbi:hypothetical protein BGZ52_004082, partial [Haplosporangium bisporale]
MPTVQVIPTKQVSDDILCTTVPCSMEFEKSVSVSTTNSLEVGAEPFCVGVKFTNSVSYGFSLTKAASAALSYSFDIVEGESG